MTTNTSYLTLAASDLFALTAAVADLTEVEFGTNWLAQAEHGRDEGDLGVVFQKATQRPRRWWDWRSFKMPFPANCREG